MCKWSVTSGLLARWQKRFRSSKDGEVSPKTDQLSFAHFYFSPTIFPLPIAVSRQCVFKWWRLLSGWPSFLNMPAPKYARPPLNIKDLLPPQICPRPSAPSHNSVHPFRNFAVKYEAGNSFVALGGRFKRLLYLNGLLRQNGQTQKPCYKKITLFYSDLES